MRRNTTPILLNLNPARVDEPDIANDEFLNSLEAVGVWLRVLAAQESGQTPRLTAACNKLKHGPQLVVQNPAEHARRFGNSPEVARELAGHEAFDRPGIRMLFAGARTGGRPADESLKSVAPFLIDDEGAVRKLFFGTMVHQANLFSPLVKMQIALYRKRRIDLDNLDPAVLEIVRAQRRYLLPGE